MLDTTLKTHFQQEIEDLKARLTRMTEAVHGMLNDALRAVADKNAELARSVIESDHTLDQMEIDVDEVILRLFACYQPMAVDLRFILNASKMSGTLERMGDQASNIAKYVLDLQNEPLGEELNEILEMAQKAVAMADDAIRSFVQSDAALAREVCRRDDEVDHMRDQVFARLVSEMRQDSSTVHANIGLLLIARNLERVADLATNIAEDVVNMVDGVIIKHHHEDALRGRPGSISSK